MGQNTLVASRLDFAGQTIADGRYRVIAELGEGNMGLVFRAQDERLETEVVLKIPTSSSLEDPEFVERFRREIRSLVQLTHPHVVKIIDVGEHQHVPYVVMQYLSGGSLKDRMCRGSVGNPRAMPAASLKDWLLEVAKALDFMHAENCIHRDVKPANILFDSHGNAFLSDFGLTKALSAEAENHSNQSLTAAGFLVGTPNYVAPELVMGRPYDGRADQYSLAMTVYEALTGKCPMEGATASATMVNQTSRVAPPLSTVVSSVPPALSDAVVKALSKKPSSRFDSCVEFAHAVLLALGTTDSLAVATGRPAPAAGSGARPVREKQSAASPGPAASRTPARSTTPAVSDEPPGTISRGQRGRVPCPACRKVLPLQQAHAGRRGRCVHCRVLLQVASDLTALKLCDESSAPPATGALRTRTDAPGLPPRVKSARDTGRGKSSRTGKHPSPAEESGELLIGEELFGLRLGRRVALILGGLLLLILIGTSIYLGQQASAPTLDDQRKADVKNTGSFESN